MCFSPFGSVEKKMLELLTSYSES
uniref:Uncharacterized protein n=1 Tax=Arundo donax TaxID=35708 RepID=A0A0A8Z8D7_ARUDO